MPDKRLPYLALSVGLSAVILAFLLAANAHYLFHAQLYEDDDIACNSLAVFRAGHFHELYGQYSRWGFHHPGPAVMYAFAWGELLFFRALHLVPTPYNAQVITLMVLVSSFLAGGISVAARWVRGEVFVPLALLFAAAHFTAADPHTWVMCAWMPFVMTVPFFGLLMASASVGAGQGDDLPFLVLAGGLMLNTHVAQPLFVGPLFIVAYAGLAWACRQSAEGRAPWRMFPRAHAFAAALAVPFVLPMFVDLWRGSRSNAVLILRHMHTHRGERHPWLDSAYCFLRFGAYKPSQPGGGQVSPGNVTPGQLGHFVHDHVLMTALWLGALLVPLLALACRRWVKPRGAAYADHPPAPAGRWRFLGWLAAIWTLGTALTLVWNHIQDGQMFYFNGWFTYGVYFALTLLAAGAVSDLVELATARARRPWLWTTLAAVLCVAATVGFLSRRIGRYRESEYDNEQSRNAARTVHATLAARMDAPRTKLLVFQQNQWETAAAVAILLTREGYPCVVPPVWNVLFGDDHAPADLFADWKSGAGGKTPVDVWHIVAAETVDPAWAARYPLVQNCALLPGLPALDPAAADAVVTFGGAHHNSTSFVLDGWSQPDGDTPSAWNNGSALLDFTPKPLPANTAVEVDFYFAAPYLPNGKRDFQRVVLAFNGQDLGVWRIDAHTPSPLKEVIPASIWNGQPSAAFRLGFPDAISPVEVGESMDKRHLAVAGEKLVFHLVPTPAE